jgi:ankyrin repeat protein
MYMWEGSHAPHNAQHEAERSPRSMKILITTTYLSILVGGALASPLHAAAARGDNDALLAELQNGADVNVVDGRKLTALHAASHAKQEEAVLTLLRHGASTQLKDGRGLSVLHLAALGGSEGVIAIWALGSHRRVGAPFQSTSYIDGTLCL